MMGCEERNMRKIDRRFGTVEAVAVAGLGAYKGIPLTSPCELYSSYQTYNYLRKIITPMVPKPFVAI